ncbi:MAG: MFS transporter [Candidatus Lokiarchaeota archaeon]|nr:MFS transporter [Candidatus Lokiarchaeota archaeon]MBD3202549.1 MFS transporter [Candidatus Lokiarchaeota archaeon]
MEKTTIELEHSKANMASFGFAKFLSEFIENAFAAWAFYFYERTIGLDSLLVGLGYIIFALWNAFNDPLMGYLTNRPFKFTKKWGRRFPWILIGGAPYVLSYILIFSPPAVDPTSGALLIFLYLIFATCLFDTFNSIFFINYVSLFPDKFRSSKERRLATGIQTPIGIFGVAVGFLVPPLIISRLVSTTYVWQALVMAIIGLVVLAISIPGIKEDQVTIDRYLERHEREEKTPFLKSLKQALKHGSFVAFIIGYTFYRCLVVSMQASVPYVVEFVLIKDDDYVTILSAGFLVGALISSPIWAWFAQKTNNNKKALLISSSLLVLFTIPLTFINSWIIMLFGMLLWGIGLGGYWTMISPVLADIIDESVVQTGKREEGIYNGFLQFFGRLGILFQAISFTLVHELTGFLEGEPVSAQGPLAIFGIQLHFALIPAIVMLIGTIIFWKKYNLTPDKVDEHQAKVTELKL